MCSNWLQPMILFQQCRLTVDIRQTDGIWAHFEVLQQRINIQWGQSLLPWCHWYGSPEIQKYTSSFVFVGNATCRIVNPPSGQLNYCIIGLNRWPGGNFGQMCNSGQFHQFFRGKSAICASKLQCDFILTFILLWWLVMVGNDSLQHDQYNQGLKMKHKVLHFFRTNKGKKTCQNESNVPWR